jgi:hypothetical protein
MTDPDDERAALFESVKHALLTTPDGAALAELVEQNPFMLDADFLLTMEQWQADAQASAGWDVAEGLRERLEVLYELAAQHVPELRAALEGFASAQTPEELARLTLQFPLMHEPSFHDLVAQLIAHAEQSGEPDDAHALRLRLDDLRRLGPGAEEMLAERTLRVLAELPNQQALLELAAQAPFVLEEAFLQRVEQRMDQAAGEGDADLAGRLRARLEGLRLIQSNVQITLPQTLEAFAAVRDAGELLALAQRAPYVLEESFAAAVEHMIAELEQAGSLQDAGALRMRLAALRELAEQRAAADASPLMQALIAFLNAHDSASARAQFVLQRELLDSDDAQILLESAFAGGDAASDQRIAERAQQLRLLRSEQHHDS